MAKRKSKQVPQIRSPLEVAARQSVTDQAQDQYAYSLRHFAERDFEGGVGLNGMRLERLACVKALEGLARSHPKRKFGFLEAYHLMAANAYHADLLALQGHRSSAYKERIDVSSKSEAGLAHRMDVSQKLSRIDQLLSPEDKAVLNRIIIDLPDFTVAQIWPNRTARNKARDHIKSGLHQLAIIYGLIKT